jgi:hypothetical protein
MLSFLIASSGPETAMNHMQRSASGGNRESRAPPSVVRTRGPHHAASCGGNRAGGKFSLLQTVEIARNGKIYGVCIDGASIQVEIETSLEHAASEVSCRLRRRSLALAASSTAPVRRKHDPVVGLDRGRGPSRSRTSARCQRRLAHAVAAVALFGRPERPDGKTDSPGNGAATA